MDLEGYSNAGGRGKQKENQELSSVWKTLQEELLNKKPQRVLVLKTLLSTTVLIYKAPCRVPCSSVPQHSVGWLGCTTSRTTGRCLSCAIKLQGQRICYAVCINYTAKTPTGLWKTSPWNPTDFITFQKPYPQLCACSKMAHPSFTQNLLSHM